MISPRIASQDFSIVIKAVLTVCLAYFMFSVTDISGKWLGRNDFFIPPYVILLFASAAGIIVTCLISVVRDGRKGLIKTVTPQSWKVHLLRGGFFFAVSMINLWILRTLPIATFYAIMFMFPFVTTILSVIILKDKVRPLRWAMIVLGFIGVLIVVKPGVDNFNATALLALGSITCGACGHLLSRYTNPDDSVLSFGFFPNLINLIAAAVLTLYNAPALPPLPLILLCVFIGIAGVFGSILTGYAFSTVRSATVAPFQYTQIIWALISGYFLFDEYPDLTSYFGIAVIIISGIVIILRENELSEEHMPTTERTE